MLSHIVSRPQIVIFRFQNYQIHGGVRSSLNYCFMLSLNSGRHHCIGFYSGHLLEVIFRTIRARNDILIIFLWQEVDFAASSTVLRNILAFLQLSICSGSSKHKPSQKDQHLLIEWGHFKQTWLISAWYMPQNFTVLTWL